MAGFIDAKQQMSTPTEAAAGFRGWSFAKEDPHPHPSVWHVHGGNCARGLPVPDRHKNEEKPVHFIPGISNSRPSHQVPQEHQWSSKPTSSRPRPVAAPVGFVREALQHQKAAELKEKARQKVASFLGRK